MVLFVDIVGNIGAGKSTVLSEVQKLIVEQNVNDAYVLYEPVDEWRAPILKPPNSATHEEDKSPLQFLYEDPKQSGFAFQMLALQTRSRQQFALPSNARIVFVERNCNNAVDVFAEDMLTHGLLTPLQYHTYTHMRKLSQETLEKFVFKHQDMRMLTIYIRTEPSLCMVRILNRGRDEECANISSDYLCRLHDLHELHYYQDCNCNSAKVIDMDAETHTRTSMDMSRMIWDIVKRTLEDL